MDQIIWAIALTSHVGFSENYNEIHPHIRYTHDDKIAGVYYNSMDQISLYAGYRYEINDFGIEAIFSTGYDNIAPVIPHSRLTYDINDNNRVFAGPAIEIHDNTTVYGIVLGIELMIN